jgi:hypothetical protein
MKRSLRCVCCSEASTKYVAWDVPTTLEALQERRVMVFAVDDAEARCMTCKALLATFVARCAYCESSEIKAVEDVVELAIEAAASKGPRWRWCAARWRIS